MTRISFVLILLVSKVISSYSQCPVITSQPVNITVCENAPTSLSVTATGQGNTYQWYWSGTNNGSGGIVPPMYPWSGYKSKDLSFALVSKGMAGQYWVKVTNTCGSVTSSVAVVTVVAKPSVVLSTNTKDVCIGSSFSFVGAPESMTSYSWVGPNNFLSNNQNPLLTNATSSMSGTYTLTVNTVNGCSNSGSINVAINPLLTPSIEILNTSSNWCEENKAVFTATTSNGGSSPSYQWFVNGNPIEGATGNTFTSTLLNNERVSCKMISNAPCITSAVTMSNSITVTRCFDNSMNYVISRNILGNNVSDENSIDQLAVEDLQEVITYFDGIGRPVQKVNWQSSPSHRDLVQPIVYDAFGREAVKYLPYVSENNSHFKANAVSESGSYIRSPQYKFYANDDNTIVNDNAPFQKIIFDPSPLNRPLKQGAIGEAWQPNGDDSYTATDKTIKNSFEFNKTGEVLLWTYSNPTAELPIGIVNAGTSSSLSYFEDNQLYKNRMKDENGNEIIEYKDKKGLVILKRVQAVKRASVINDVNYASTYYIYDDLGSLVCVIPPEAVKQITATSSIAYFDQTDAVKDAFLKRWTFRYEYDSRRRMIQKQVPGAEAVYLVYDNRDRLVLTQDGNQRVNKQWTFTKYDGLNRPIATGIKDTTAVFTPAEMQVGIEAHYAKPWAKYGETYIGVAAKNVHAYTNFSYPTVTTSKVVDANRYLTITYYDTYAFKSYIGVDYDYVNEGLSETVNGYIYNQPVSEFKNVIGQVTGTRVRVLDSHIASSSTTWLNSVNYYDDKYRLIQAIPDNYKSGRDRISNLYDFTGKVLKSKLTHTRITWKDMVAARRMGNRIDKTDLDGWTSGGASVEMLPANTDGWMEFTTSATNKALMIGLSETNTNVNWGAIKYALYLTNTAKVEVRENGSANLLTISPTYAAGDLFRIERKEGKIKFYRNGAPLTERAATTNALLIDFAIYNNRGAICNLRSSFGNFTPYEITRRFEYDHAGRLTHTWHQIGSQQQILLSKNEYNELGQLIDKKLHSTNRDATDAKQSVDYRYNIRSWLTSINNAELNNDGITNDDGSDYFGLNLAYNEALGTGNEEIKSDLDNALVSSYAFNENANDDAPNGINGVVTAATLTTDSQGNSNKAYNFSVGAYIEIPNSLTKHSFIQNTGKFTISAFIKIGDLNARNVIVGNTATSVSKGFTLMYETYGGGYGDHQLRFITTIGTNSVSFSALGGVRTINDNNWHHVAVVGDGHSIRFYVDGVQDGATTPMTIFSTGAASATTLIGRTRIQGGVLSMVGSIDEVKILSGPATQSEIYTFASRGELNTVQDGKQYNGNISAMKWSVNQGLSETKEMAYNFKYDPLNRLESATNLQSASLGVWNPGKFHEGELTYDLNGNIKTLTRYNEKNAMDILSYTYTSGANSSNQLLKVVDIGDKYKGFIDGTNTDNDYTYDANGNMTADKNKGVTAIAYNMLNLPITVTRGVNTANYIYDATGRKLAEVTYFLNSTKQTDYAGEFKYVNDVLQSVQHEEGRIVLATEKTIYVNDGGDLNSVTTANGTTLSSVTQASNQNYIKVASNGTTTRGATLGGILPVQPGERYRIRAKGYRVGSNNVYLLARTNLGNILWGAYWMGSQLSSTWSTESWVEETITIPVGATQLEAGLYWSVAASTDYFLVNDFEITKLGEHVAPEYQYNLKDHLGNVRLTFTTKVEADIYTATFEDNTQSTETNNFENYSRVTSDIFDHTDAGTTYSKAQMLNGGAGLQVGLAKTFSVMPGDVIKAEVYAKYLGAEGGSVDLTTFGAALLSAFNLSAPLAGETGTARAALQDYGTFIGGNGNPGNEDSPKGWLNILVFDRNHNLIDLAFEQLSSAYAQEIGSAVKAPHQLLSKEVTITEPGYVYIYISNEGSVAQEVYFDDFKVEHSKSPVIQTEDYYPFGLTFNEFRRENGIYNPYLYNGKEKQDELDLNWLDHGARMYVAELGRWVVADPWSEKMLRHSPYCFSFNNPVFFNDLNGKGPNDFFTDGTKVYWSNSRASSIKNKDGTTLTNIGSSITIRTTSFIPKNNDVPFFGSAAGGDKLQTSVIVTGNYDSKGKFSGFSATSESPYIGESFDNQFLPGAEGVEGKTNTFSQGETLNNGFRVSLETHTEANWKEVNGLDMLGSRVDVNQKLNVKIDASGKVSIDIGHGTYPSVRMDIPGVSNMPYQYSAQSFLYSHANHLLSDPSYEGQAMMQQRRSDVENAAYRGINQATFRGFTSAPFLWHSSLSWTMYK
jgi:RHS repeat-associated protein